MGASASAPTGRPATEIFHRIPEFRDLLLDTLRTRVGVLQASLILPRADGRLVPVEVATDPPSRSGGTSPRGGCHPSRSDAGPPLEEQLRRSDRLAALGTLAAGLAHEIKKPFTIADFRAVVQGVLAEPPFPGEGTSAPP